MLQKVGCNELDEIQPSLVLLAPDTASAPRDRLTGSLLDAVNTHVHRTRCRTDLGEMAQIRPPRVLLQF
jgi:hypothetical protein